MLYLVATSIAETDKFSTETNFIAQDKGNNQNPWDGIAITDNRYFGGENNPSIVDDMIEALVGLIKIGGINLTDNLTQYFDFKKDLSGDLSYNEETHSIMGDNIELEKIYTSDGQHHYSWTGTILVKAKENFVGADIVPTNISDGSGIVIPGGDEIQNFTIVGEDNKPYDLETPYVDVKLLPIVGQAQMKQFC